MQTNFPAATENERQVIRTWRIRVLTFYSTLCAILLVLSFVSDRTAPTVAGAPSAASSLEAMAAR